MRALGDLASSMANGLLGMRDSRIPQNRGDITGVALKNAQVGRESHLHVSILYFAHAYKHMGSAADQLEGATISRADPEGQPAMAAHRPHPFGGGRGPAIRGRLEECLQHVAAQRPSVWRGDFVADCYAVGAADAIASASDAADEIWPLLVRGIATGKEQVPSDPAELIGASAHLVWGPRLMRLPSRSTSTLSHR